VGAGATLVLAHDLVRKRRARAIRAAKPAPIITAGLAVVVQQVIAAITTEPSLSSYSWLLSIILTVFS